jgi:hypothetical protein
MFRSSVCLSVIWALLWPLAAPTAQPGDPIPLALSLAAVSQPSLKYRLLLDPRDLTPGNAATLYYRSGAFFLENQALLKDLRDEQWDDWLRMPLPDLPREAVRARVCGARRVLHELELAAQCRECDWQLEGRREGIGLVLPEVQFFRRFGVVLAVRARLEIAEGKWPEAIRSLQAGYALARHLGEGPTLIHVLVGAAIAQMMSSQVEAWTGQPGAPNLYWALTVLPRPFIDPAPAIRAESSMLEYMIPGLKGLEKGPVSIAEVQAVTEELRKTLDGFGLRAPGLAETTARTALLVQTHPAAKQFLRAHGYTAEQVEAMPVPQAVLLFAFLDYRQAWDEAAKWAHVPDGFHQPGYRPAGIAYSQALERLDRLFFRGLLKALGEGTELPLEKVYATATRLDRRLAALRCIEAIRLYAASHNGNLPPALADCREGPAPADPVTGKPFEYKVVGDRATLTAPFPPGPKPPPGLLLSYQLTLRR